MVTRDCDKLLQTIVGYITIKIPTVVKNACAQFRLALRQSRSRESKTFFTCHHLFSEKANTKLREFRILSMTLCCKASCSPLKLNKTRFSSRLNTSHEFFDPVGSMFT